MTERDEPLTEQQAWEQATARNVELGREKQRVRGPKTFALAVQDKDGNWVVEERKDESKAGWLKSFTDAVFQAPWSR